MQSLIRHVPKQLWPTSDITSWMCDECQPGLVSVIIPTHNRVTMLARAVDSVFLQTYRPIEMIILDDGSTDGTCTISAEWGKRLSEDGFRIRYHGQENRGAPAARTTALCFANGEYIQYLDSDDELACEKLSRQVDIMTAEPEIDVVYGDSVTGRERCTATRVQGIPNADDMVVMLLGRQYNPNFAYLCRRRVVSATGPWDPGVACMDDWDYFLRMAIAGAQFAYYAGETGLYRRHAGACISRTTGLPNITSTLRILERAEMWMNGLGCWSEQRRKAIALRYLDTAYRALKVNPLLFDSALCNAVRHDPDVAPSHPLRRLLVSAIGHARTQRLYDIGRCFYGMATGR